MQNRCVAFGKHHFDVIMSIQNRSDDVTNDKTNALTMHSVRHYCRGDQSAYFLVVEDSYDVAWTISGVYRNISNSTQLYYSEYLQFVTCRVSGKETMLNDVETGRSGAYASVPSIRKRSDAE